MGSNKITLVRFGVPSRQEMMRGLSALVIATVASALGCSDEGSNSAADCAREEGNLGIEFKADLEVTLNGAAAKEKYSFDGSSLTSPKFYVFQIQNIAAANAALPLTIESVLMAETDSDGKAVSSPAFSCQSKGGNCSDAVFGSVIPNGFVGDCVPDNAVKSEEIIVRYDPGGVSGTRKALLRLRVAGDPEFADKTLDINFTTTEGQPRLSCVPKVVDFGQLAAGKGGKEKIECRSIGSAPVILSKVELLSKTKPDLKVSLQNKWVLSVDEAYEGKPSITIPPGAALAMEATLSNLASDEPVGATMHIFSNDDSTDKHIVQMFANSTGPCFTLKPNAIDFGDVPVGGNAQKEVQLKGCGTEAAKVVGIELDKSSHSDLALDLQPIGGKAPTPEAPLEVFPGATQAFNVLCKPSAIGNAIKGVVKVTDSDGDERLVNVKCTAAKLQKPTACIEVKPGTTVIPQTPLTLVGKCSKAGVGKAIAKHVWSVSQPTGSVALLSSTSGPEVKFQPNVAGDYKFTLEVMDDAGTKSDAATILVNVLPDNKLHVEATWVQPGDKIKNDKKGCDLDLHLAHPLASKVKGQGDLDGDGQPDPWFAQCYDCFWINCKPPGQPQWGDLADLGDDPAVDLDDVDGWGPENLSIQYPEKKINGQDAWYWVGVYNFNDQAMGACTPKVRIFLDAVEVFNKKGPPMVTKDMWCVGRVRWDGKGDAADVKKCFPNGKGKELRPKYMFKPPTQYKCPPPM